MSKYKEYINFTNFFAFCIFFSIYIYFFNKNDPAINEVYKSILMLIVGYIYGSSKNSQKKDETIQAMQEDKTKSVIADNVDTQNVTVENKP